MTFGHRDRQSSSTLALMWQRLDRRHRTSKGVKVGCFRRADEPAGSLPMLPASTWKSGKGHMAAMERLLAGGSSLEFSAEEVAHENVAVKTVQREMNEADELNLLEEEDMHVFDREPLADRLPLVSCNTCKKPIKASQYSAHAERCRSLTASEDTAAELDGGANHKKPPRKARKKLVNAQDTTTGAADRERLQSVDNDDAAHPDSGGTSVGTLDEQAPSRAGFSNSRGQKRVMNLGEGTVVNAAKSGRTRKTSIPIGSEGRNVADEGGGMGTGSNNSSLTMAELDVLCGVQLDQGARCRNPLTCKVHSETSKRAVTGRRQTYDSLLQELKANNNRLRSSKSSSSVLWDVPEVGPLPMATKIYYLRHKQRLRGIIGGLYHEACARDSSPGTSPNSLSSEQAAPSAPPTVLSSDNCALELNQQLDGLQQKGPAKKMQNGRVILEGNPSLMGVQIRGYPGGLDAIPGNQSQQSDGNYSLGGGIPPVGQYMFGKGPLLSASPLLGAGTGGVSVNTKLQPPFGGVSVT